MTKTPFRLLVIAAFVTVFVDSRADAWQRQKGQEPSDTELATERARLMAMDVDVLRMMYEQNATAQEKEARAKEQEDSEVSRMWRRHEGIKIADLSDALRNILLVELRHAETVDAILEAARDMGSPLDDARRAQLVSMNASELESELWGTWTAHLKSSRGELARLQSRVNSATDVDGRRKAQTALDAYTKTERARLWLDSSRVDLASASQELKSILLKVLDKATMVDKILHLYVGPDGQP